MKKVLVAYFSASGTTKALATTLAKEIGADLFEIAPETPYTDEDLDWEDTKSRSSVEMNDPACRPGIASKVENMAQYNVVFVGFPIWWYREPSIIDTFAEAYDFNGKTIIPFATSGSSEIGDSGKNIAALAKGAAVEEGKRFAADVSAEEMKAWAEKYL